MINALASNLENYNRNLSFNESARACWHVIISNFLDKNKDITILLPSYIGWSANEGSGIFDPVKDLSCKYDFYKISKNLQIDFNDLKRQVEKNKNILVLIVHYFGFPDYKYSLISNWLLTKKINFVEDCAHALFSDFCGGSCGRLGDASFYSLHKMLPTKTGGMLSYKSNNNHLFSDSLSLKNLLVNSDLHMIFNRRRKNAIYLTEKLNKLKNIILLHSEIPFNVCPQTIPIILMNNRDKIYFKMNENGFGMVSLYHTMINEISADEFPESHNLSKSIINFPIHQDVSFAQIDSMIDCFTKLYDND